MDVVNLKLTVITPEMHCDQTVMGLPLVTSVVFVIIKSLSSSSSAAVHYNPLLDIGILAISLNLRLLASSSCQPCCA
jgi:hypothetical protein